MSLIIKILQIATIASQVNSFAFIRTVSPRPICQPILKINKKALTPSQGRLLLSSDGSDPRGEDTLLEKAKDAGSYFNANYPIDLPSPILLGGSVVVAIAATGSLYQGVWLAVIGLPIALYLFYASILKGMAETEADDELYLGRKES